VDDNSFKLELIEVLLFSMHSQLLKLLKFLLVFVEMLHVFNSKLLPELNTLFSIRFDVELIWELEPGVNLSVHENIIIEDDPPQMHKEYIGNILKNSPFCGVRFLSTIFAHTISDKLSAIHTF
jgi:hypothetical protein